MSVPANFFDTYDVVASPVSNAETVIAILGGVGELLPGLSVHLHGFVNLVPGTDGTAVALQVRRDGIGGQSVGDSAKISAVAADTADGVTATIEVVDFPGDFAGATYVLTAQVDDASAPSTVGIVHLGARTC